MEYSRSRLFAVAIETISYFSRNGLFKLLRNRKSGCWIQGNYVGILGYADDNFLLAPSEEA